MEQCTTDRNRCPPLGALAPNRDRSPVLKNVGDAAASTRLDSVRIVTFESANGTKTAHARRPTSQPPNDHNKSAMNLREPKPLTLRLPRNALRYHDPMQLADK